MNIKHLSTIILCSLGFTQLNATNPVFKSCGCEIESACNQEKLETLKLELKETLIKKKGYYFNDSIMLEFTVSEKGKLEISSSFHLYSDLIHEHSKNLLAAYGDQFCAGERYRLSLNFELPQEIASFEEVEQVRRPVPVKGTENFNLTAKRGATRYLAYNASKSLLENENPQGDHSGRIYLSKGNIVGIEFTSLNEETRFSDLIAYAFYEENQALVNSSEVSSSDNQWIEFNLSPVRDSTGEYNYQAQRLQYLEKLQDPKPYLQKLFDFSAKYYEGEQKTEFLLAQLSSAGYLQTDSFRIHSKLIRIDSIASYEVSEKEQEDKEVLNFAEVETVPVFQNCNPKSDNDELKLCFQNGILKYVAYNFKFPEEARKRGIQGRNYTSFVIEKDGSIGVVEIVRGTHPMLDLEAIRVVSEIPKVTPAMQRGKPVRMSFTLPINAKLQ